jgi:hypothetical protein
MGIGRIDRALAVILACAALSFGCQTSNSRENSMTDEAFFRMPLPSYERHPCSPEVSGNEPGIAINAPAKVDVAARGMLPICGTYRLTTTLLNELGTDPGDQTVLTFVDKRSNASFSFNLKPDKDRVEKDGDVGLQQQASPGPEVPSFEVLLTTHFNVDVLGHLPALEGPRTFIVYATLRTLKSRSIEIRIQ